MADTHQWVIIVGEEPPPPEIPWLLIGGAAVAAVGIGIIVFIRRK